MQRLQSTLNQHAKSVLTTKKPTHPRPTLTGLFLEAVDHAFSTLGDSSKALYFSLKNSFGVSREAIPNHIEVFAYVLEQVFGRVWRLLGLTAAASLSRVISRRRVLSGLGVRWFWRQRFFLKHNFSFILQGNYVIENFSVRVMGFLLNKRN